MQCIPAIDIKEGRCVRLFQGDFSKETLYGSPLERARELVEGGATMLHIVDLDAARTGEPTNSAVIADIRSSLHVTLEVSGGIRTKERVDELLSSGIDRVVLGTVAMDDPLLLDKVAGRYGDQIVVGIDHRLVGRDGVSVREVSVRGWEQTSGIALLDALTRLEDLPIGGLIVTAIERDGTLSGPDLVGLREVLSVSSHRVIASGGVGKTHDLVELVHLEAEGRSLDGVIVGRAILSGALSVKEAIASCEA